LQSNNTSLFQSAYDLNSFLNDNISSSYGVDSFDLSLLGSDYTFDNYQSTQIKCEDVTTSQNNNNLTLSIEIDNGYQYPMQIQVKQEDNHDWQQQQYYLQSSSLLSPISPAATIHSSPSPCPSIDYSCIKQEQQLFLPPSPPDSNGVPSPQSNYNDNYKLEFDEQSYANQAVLSPNCSENAIDIKYLLESSNEREKQQDHQVLREFLQDTTFQRKHNLKPLALESLFGGLTQQGDIEPVICLALQHAKQEVQATCIALKISPDPQQWTEQQVQLWITSTIKQFKLDSIVNCELVFPENGQMFAMLSDEEFIRRVPQVR
jgi:Sterile alpha motif (SAM)/Pointed domain